MLNAYFYETAIGRIGIAEEGGAITNVFFGGTVSPKSFVEKETPLLCQAAKQLEEYFAGTRKEFSLPCAPQGTPFQREVWDALLEIPYGETRTYGEIASCLGRPTASRAVGAANSRNPISFIVPCHRVVGAGGKLTGYAGGIPLKQRLLDMEQSKP